ncbi:CapA family protein [Pseudonocardia sp. MH-G8]|uniref:CapA family protein n=1 Tax=Pseudonocardia sp. MH-G8 TaxID=1854588 RepID=UPI00117BC10E|nr:CapA family protein [Pseudonocardia sp. MH-G8]
MNDAAPDVFASLWLAVTGDVVPVRPLSAADARLRALLRSADLAVGNLETPLTTATARADKAATLRAHPDRVAEVTALGFDLVTLANNHHLDYGVEGMRDTRAALRAAGVDAVGSGETAAEALRTVVRSTRAGDVAVIGLCSALPPGFAATEDRPGIAPLRVLQQVSIDPSIAAEQPGAAPYVHTQAYAPDLEAACAEIRRVRDEVTLVVVAVHWGVPHGFAATSYGVLAEYQRPAAHRLVDSGADLVVGHHPHVVHPIERYGDGLIAYSIGNYLFHGWSSLSGAARADGPIAGQPFPLQIPAAPYQNPFGSAANEESVVLVVELPDPGSGRLTVDFVPTVMVDGEPVLPGPERAAAVLQRLVEPALPTWDHGATPALAHCSDLVPGTTVGRVSVERRR